VGGEPRKHLTPAEKLCHRLQWTCAQQVVQPRWYFGLFVGDPPDKNGNRFRAHLLHCCSSNPSLSKGLRRRVVDASPLIMSQPVTQAFARVLRFRGGDARDDQADQSNTEGYA